MLSLLKNAEKKGTWHTVLEIILFRKRNNEINQKILERNILKIEAEIVIETTTTKKSGK